ncbi:DUF2911 domain-containing protein [Mucilaginibacter limnophilus]|uniref:DUF2911 domain-containing protein n=1 Tax=Mucilaginibacter limnophilus TaxID=1932778 RepID=A0A437MRX5_9SPHI|nr:DUF2911 domain-containing protein [Mucilaginibacter limnophilus]RVU00386.1 DUF2911 domain-containing protein [Mucilaginibacter limnophilus]
MKNFRVYLFALFLIACFNTKTFAQQQQPRIPEASSTQTLIQDFGLGKITVTYSRPNVRDRKIFGGIQPYGEVWRTGANWATTITFSEETTVEGNKVPAGTYALFTIPGEKEWTIILNNTPKQWGAYTYKQSDDFIRFKVPSINLKEKRETFTIAFANVTTKTCDFYLLWDYTAVAIKMGTNDDAQIVANIDQLMKGPKKPYFNAIQYYYENNHDLNKALAWAQEAEKAEPKAPWFKLWKARVLLKLGRKQEAITAAQEGVGLAKSSDDDEYVRLNEAVLAKAMYSDSK